MDHAIFINRRRSVSGIIHTLIGVVVCWKVEIQPDIASDSTDREIRYMYKAVNKTNIIRRYMKALALQNGATVAHWEYNTRCIYVVESKRVTSRVKHI